ncbi:HAMP domain-containing sensor histidine kinase [Candidatus Enterococcus clewellii]|uniref:sensor histidine kinase n=1 Tax=Candidatus Enterococcus clewellii TaxID=1834193 RepID=UPI0030CF8947
MKNSLLKKNLNEISQELSTLVSTQSNTLLSVSTGDKQVKRLANALNHQLRIVRKQRQEYLSKDRELKEAVTNISHDLRTPLTAICGYLELLETEEKAANVTRYLEIIRNRVNMMETLTEELFSYSVIISSENEATKERVILNDILEESIAAFYGVLKERGIEPVIHLPEQKVSRCLPRTLLSRMVANLLNNAVKYSDGDLMITLLETGELTFTNTTTALDAVQVGKLFDRFYTVNTAKYATGLGLGIARTFVEQMNGQISAEYEENKLSICVRFPES